MSDVTYYKSQLTSAKTQLANLKNKLIVARRSGADTSSLQSQVDRYQNLVTDLTAKVVASNDASTKSTDKLSSTLTNSLKESGVSTSDIKKSASDYTSSVSDTISSTITDISASVSDLATASVANLASSAKSAASSLFGSSNSSTAVLSSAKADVGKSETDSKLKSISSDDTTAIAETVAFVTKPVTETVSSAKSAESETIKETVPTTGQLASEVKKLKESGSDGSLSSAISGISNDLSSKLKATSEYANSVKNNVTDSNNGLLTSISGSVKDSIESTIKFASPVTGTLAATITAGKDLTNQVVDMLPSPVGKYITKTTNDFLQEQSAAILGDKLNSLKNVAKILPGVTDTSNLWTIIQGLGGSYSKAVDKNSGKDLSGKFGSTNSSTADALYAAANTICNNINRPDSYNYSQNKDLFDTLLQLAASLGMTDLITQLSKCTNGENSYFDSRSKELLKSLTRSTATKGDVNTYNTLVKIIGPANVSEAKKDLAILAANTSSTTAKSDVSVWKETSEILGIKSDAVVSSSTPVGSAYSGTSVALMSASNTDIVDSIISSDDRALIQASVFQYA